MFHAICLAILLQQKLREKLPGVTYPKTNITCKFCGCRNRCEKRVLPLATIFATLQRIFEVLRCVTCFLQRVSQRFLTSAN